MDFSFLDALKPRRNFFCFLMMLLPPLIQGLSILPSLILPSGINDRLLRPEFPRLGRIFSRRFFSSSCADSFLLLLRAFAGRLPPSALAAGTPMFSGENRLDTATGNRHFWFLLSLAHPFPAAITGSSSSSCPGNVLFLLLFLSFFERWIFFLALRTGLSCFGGLSLRVRGASLLPVCVVV